VATTKVIPAKLNYVMTRGDDFADSVTINEGEPPEPADVSGRTYTAQVRSAADSTTVVASMTIDMSNAASGIVGYSIPDTTTDDMSGAYVWDFQQVSGTVTRTLMGGGFTVLKDVTRAS
jgi:hypothetical protein